MLDLFFIISKRCMLFVHEFRVLLDMSSDALKVKKALSGG